jgi:retron-type reverse transcriptase
MDTWFDQIVSLPNLYRAAHAASLGKKSNPDVALFRFRLEALVLSLHNDLASGRYRHGKYRIFSIFEPKKREIAKAPFRDRVVHHAVHDVIESVLDRSFFHDSYACRKGKGTHAALARARSFLMASNFCLHGDVTKYFPSVNRDILRRLLYARVGEKRLRALLDEIIDSAAHVFPGNTGLPIGNLTSQFFANLYLHELDHFVKHVLRCRYYIRYMDDFLLFDDDPAVLAVWKDRIRDFLLSNLALRLHENKTALHSTRRGFAFLGFYISRTGTRVAAQGLRRLRARLKHFRYLRKKGAVTEEELASSIACWGAHSAYAETVALRMALAGEAAQWSAAVPAALLSLRTAHF